MRQFINRLLQDSTAQSLTSHAFSDCVTDLEALHAIDRFGHCEERNSLNLVSNDVRVCKSRSSIRLVEKYFDRWM